MDLLWNHCCNFSILGDDESHDSTAGHSFNSKDELFHKIENMKIISMENEKKSDSKKKKLINEEKVPSLAQMTSRNEKDLVNARKAFYSQAKVNEQHLKLGDQLGKPYNKICQCLHDFPLQLRKEYHW